MSDKKKVRIDDVHYEKMRRYYESYGVPIAEQVRRALGYYLSLIEIPPTSSIEAQQTENKIA